MQLIWVVVVITASGEVVTLDGYQDEEAAYEAAKDERKKRRKGTKVLVRLVIVT